MDSKILEYIIAVAEEKSVSRAADRFYLSQSVLSHHLKNLEEEFGEPFFTRDPKGMQLTRAGIIFVNNARTILHMEQQLEAKMENLRRRQYQSIRVMVDSTSWNFVIRNILGAYRKLYPDITLELIDGNFVQAQRTLQTGGADLAIFTCDRTAWEGFHTEELFRDRVHFLLPAGWESDLTLEEMREAVEKDLIVCLHPVGTSMRLVEEQLLVQQKSFPAVIMESRSFKTSLAQALDGQCGIFYPGGLMVGEATRLKRVPDLQGIISCQMVYPQEEQQPAPFRRLLEVVREAFQGYTEYARTIPIPDLKGPKSNPF